MKCNPLHCHNPLLRPIQYTNCVSLLKFSLFYLHSQFLICIKSDQPRLGGFLLTYCEIGLPSTSLGPDLCLLNIYTKILSVWDEISTKGFSSIFYPSSRNHVSYKFQANTTQSWYYFVSDYTETGEKETFYQRIIEEIIFFFWIVCPLVPGWDGVDTVSPGDIKCDSALPPCVRHASLPPSLSLPV